MSEVKRDIQQMEQFASTLEAFIGEVNSMCSSMESGISGLRSFMEDPGTVRAMTKAEAASVQIKSVLAPAQNVLEKIRAGISAARDAEASGGQI